MVSGVFLRAPPPLLSTAPAGDVLVAAPTRPSHHPRMHYRLLARLDSAVSPVRPALLPYCRLRLGEVWCDPEGRHTVACGDAADRAFVRRLFGARRATLAVQDPPYNLVMGQKLPPEAYANWCRAWVDNTDAILA
ncbi:MAG TPA: hypothetical protein PK112_07690, partial [candidate division Zixibacteria bacterium]|nr:hypothetical protein [candidate division Zixibacteria bacterium]